MSADNRDPIEPRQPIGIPTRRYEYEKLCFFGNSRVCDVLLGNIRGFKKGTFESLGLLLVFSALDDLLVRKEKKAHNKERRRIERQLNNAELSNRAKAMVAASPKDLL